MVNFGNRRDSGLRLVVSDRVRPPYRRRLRLPSWTAAVLLVGMAVAVGALTLKTAQSEAKTYSRNMPICNSSKRINCVVDGDTIWLDGEKIRLEGFNTPEMNGECNRESQLARKARSKLSRALSSNPFEVARGGHDRYGRRLATVSVNSVDVGDPLIRDGLAHVWRGRKQDWCG